MNDQSNSMTMTRNATPKEIIKENLRTLLKNPFALAAEIDPAWVQHAKAELIRVAKFKVEVHEETKRREAAGKEAGEAAKKEFAKLAESKKVPTRADLLARLEKAGPARFELEAKACNLLATYVHEFASMEFMAKTQKGQKAWFSVEDLLKELSKQAQQAYDEYEEWKEQLTFKDMSKPAHELDYVHVKVFEAKYSAHRETELADKLIEAAQVCANAIHFETIKAYVVARLEDTDEDPDYYLNKATDLAAAASGGVTAAGSVTPGQPGTIVTAVGAFVDSGTNIVKKMVTSAIRTRRVKKIMKDPKNGMLIVEAMNEDPTIMADYLRAKFNDQLQYNLAAVKPIIAADALLLDAACLGVPAGNILNILWDSVVTALVKAADRIQKQRIHIAKEKFLALKEKGEVEPQSAKIWERAATVLDADLSEIVEKTLNEGPNIALLAKNGIQFGQDIPGRKMVIEAITDFLMKKVLTKMKVPPAAIWSGDDFVKNLTRFSTFGADLKKIGFGDREAS